MINFKLAGILTDIAEFKKSGESRKVDVPNLLGASRTIMDTPEGIDKIYKSGRIKDLYGMEGPALDYALEYLEKGSIGFYEELKSRYGQDLIKLVRISGLGKRKMFKVYEALKVTGLEELKEKLSENLDNRIYGIIAEDISGSGRSNPFYIERLKDSVDYMESIRGIYPRWRVELCANEIKNALLKAKSIEEAVVVGSLRRKKPAVRDIDILILPVFNGNSLIMGESAKLLDELKSLDFIKGLKGSDTRQESISARFGTVFGIDVEFIVSSRKNWAYDMLYTTGSREHIKKLEEAALRKGYVKDGRIKVNGNLNNFKNHGETLPDGGELPCEAGIYDMLGLKYIPPELREGRDEVEIAGKNLLPSLITMNDIKGDLHVHSGWSDGSLEIDELIKKARELNYEYLAVTDHSVSNYYGRGLSDERVLEKMKYINKLKTEYKDFHILMGSEIDIKRAGELDYPESIIEKMEIAIGSMHSSYLNSKTENTTSAVRAVGNKNIDFIGHPTGAFFGNRAPYSIDVDYLIEAAARNGKALEINSYFLRLDLNEQNARKAAKMGVKLVINTDTHRPINMDMITLGVDVARRAGLEKKDILNTLTFEELMEWKEKRN
jgi:DNA polymerase (family X)